MAHYALLDENNIVVEVFVGKDEDDGDIDWEEYYGAVRTSYNTFANKHVEGGTPFRYNFAGIGYTFDPDFGTDGAFIPPKPNIGMQLDPETALWVTIPGIDPETGKPFTKEKLMFNEIISLMPGYNPEEVNS